MLIELLTRRGYWEEAGAEDGTAGGGTDDDTLAGGDSGADDTGAAGAAGAAGGDDDGAGDTDGGDGDSADGDKDEDGSELHGAPEAYDPEGLTLPDGFELNDEALQAFDPIAKELDLSQAGLQKVVDAYAQIEQQRSESAAEQMLQTEESWLEAIKKDNEMGGDDWEKNLANVTLAVEKFGNDDLKDLLNTTRLGSHPEVVRFLKHVGDALSEDGMVHPGAAGQGQKSAAQTLYPDTN